MAQALTCFKQNLPVPFFPQEDPETPACCAVRASFSQKRLTWVAAQATSEGIAEVIYRLKSAAGLIQHFDRKLRWDQTKLSKFPI